MTRQVGVINFFQCLLDYFDVNNQLYHCRVFKIHFIATERMIFSGAPTALNSTPLVVILNAAVEPFALSEFAKLNTLDG